ncbi:hypothetical protein Tco_0515105 [Tanacetum coccineum]
MIQWLLLNAYELPLVEFPQIDSGLAIPTFLPGDDLIACMNKAMEFLSAVFTLHYPSTNNQLRYSSNPRNQATVQDGRATEEDKVRMLSVQVYKRMLKVQGEIHQVKDATWFKEKVLLVQAQAVGKELDEEQLAFLADPRVADAKAVLMANLSSYDSDVLLEAIVQNTNTFAQQNFMILSMFEQMSNHATNWDKANNKSKIVNESLTAELERYTKRVKILEQRFNVDLSGREKFIDTQMDDMIQMKNTKFAAFETEIDTLKHALSKHVKEKLLTTLNGFKTEFKERESKSINKEIVLENKNKELENIVYLSVEKKFWLQSSDKNSEEPRTSNTPVKIEVPNELPKFDKGLHDKITEVQTVFTQMEADVEQCSVDKKCCEIQQKQFLFENDRLLDKIASQEIVNIVLNSLVIIYDFEKKNEDSVDTCNKYLELEAKLVKKNDFYTELSKCKKGLDEIETINIELEHCVAKLLSENEKLHKENEHLTKTYKELYDSIKPSRVHAKEQCDSLIANLNSKKLKGKNVIYTVVSKPYATTIAPRMFKLDLEPLALKVLKNKDTHLEYIKHSREHAEILQEIVKSARALSPLDSNLDIACKYVQRIQEVLVYIRDTCLCLTRPSEKLVVVTPKNKDKKVRFADPVTSLSNTQKQVDSHKPKDSNQPFLHSTGVISFTGASGSKPTSNTKKQ